MEEHHKTGDGGTLEHGPSFEESDELSSLESGRTVDVLREALGGNLLLEKSIGLDLKELELNQGIGLGSVTKVGECLASFVVATLAEKPTRAEGDPEATEAKAKSGNGLQGQLKDMLAHVNNGKCTYGKSPADAAGIADVVASVAGPVGKHDTCPN